MIDLLTEAEAAKLLHVTGKTLRNLRVSGRGPKFVQVTKRGRVLYDPEDLVAFINSKKRHSTTDVPPSHVPEDRAATATH